MYITWEEENKMLKEVTAVYDLLLSTPTQMYSQHFEKFCKHVKSNYPRDILTTDEFLELRQQVVANSHVSHDDVDDERASDKANEALPPGVDADDAPPGLEAPEKIEKDMMTETEIESMKKKIIEKRKDVHEKNEIEVGKRWTFEEGIRRPYFHVKALEDAQLKNWKAYLDFEIENGDHQRTLILFERCMIACALYEAMWLKYAKYMEENAPEQAADVYERACTIHLPKKPAIHFSWATYEEAKGNIERASAILENLLLNIPDLIETMCRIINLERRRKNFDNVDALYKRFIAGAKTVKISTGFAKKYARFLYKVHGNYEKAREVLQEAILRDSTNPSLYMQLADIAFQSNPVDENKFCEAIDMALASDMSEDLKLVFSHRKLEFYEDFGSDPRRNQEAYEDYAKRMKIFNNASRKRAHDESEEAEKGKKSKGEVNGVASTITDAASTAAAAVAAATTAAAGATAVSTATQDAAAYYQQSPWMGYQHNSYNYHQSWNPYHSSYYSTH